MNVIINKEAFQIINPDIQCFKITNPKKQHALSFSQNGKNNLFLAETQAIN